MVASGDAAKAMATIEDHIGRDIDPETRARAERPVDFDAAETECPACGTRFETAGQQRCPDCGLNFGG